MKISVIITTYNEILTIAEIIEQVINVDLGDDFEKEIIVVDNISNDGTRELLRKLEKEKDIQVIYQTKNLGKSFSFRTAIPLCSGDYVISQDADLEYNPQDITKILNHLILNDYDVVIGSRIETGKRYHAYKINEYGIDFLNKITNLLFRTEYTDVATCYKLMKSDILKDFNLKCNGFDLDYELCAKFNKIKIRAGEKSIKYSSRSFQEGRKTIFSENNIYVDGLKGLYVILKEKFY